MLIALCTVELLTARYAPGRKLRTLLLWLPALHIVGGIGVLFLASRLAPIRPMRTLAWRRSFGSP